VSRYDRHSAQTRYILPVVIAVIAVVVGAIVWSTSRRSADDAGEIVTGGKRQSTDASPKNILLAIRNLESGSDPKCHSTACRLENFVFGTPLSDEARDQKVVLQKELVLQIWIDGSRRLADAGAESITPEQIQPAMERVATSTPGQEGELVVHFHEGKEVVKISTVRLRQFSSVAYALRALLSVQQDAILGETDLTELNAESTTALRKFVDLVTLCALKLADQEAREQSEPQVTRQRMRAAWRRLMPEPAATESTGKPSIAPSVAEEGPRSENASLKVLLAIIDNKFSAYLHYNRMPLAELKRRFWQNTQTYYVMFPLPIPNPKRMEQLDLSFQSLMNQYTRDLVERAEQLAVESGHAYIRGLDATEAVQALTPHRIDDFEDVHFFYTLNDDQISLESYDCDSFRDTGAHWLILKSIYADPSQVPMIVDPFAAEIITEAISGYGVLLFRVAGQIARETESTMPILRPLHLQEARLRIMDLASKHRHAKQHTQQTPSIISSDATSRSQDEQRYFSEVTEESGVQFLHGSTKWLSEFRRNSNKPPTFSGGGVAADDINNDSYPDLLFVGGIGNALLVGDGKGGFRDFTEQSGIAFVRSDGTHGEARQPIIADFDNDGNPDILITYNHDKHRLYHNLGDLRFQDVSKEAGLGGQALTGGPATVFDFDNDGLLDIYLAYFGPYLEGALPRENRNNLNSQPNKLFRNLGSLRFEDVTEGSGTDDRGWCQAVSHSDVDRDGLQDIILANDFGRNAILRNLGNGRFENIAESLGLTKAYHSMNIGITDLNRDGFPDIYVSNIATMVKDNKYVFPDVNTPLKFGAKAMASMLIKEANVLYMSQSEGVRLQQYKPSTDVERGESTTGWAWDGEFFDFDNDGDDDLYVVNGANDYNIYRAIVPMQEEGRLVFHHMVHQRQTNVFYVNEGGKLKNQSSRSGTDFSGNSRSTAYLDWDGDGDLDIAVNNFHTQATMLQNNSEALKNHWVKIRLVGDPNRNSNRDAIGARIVATNDTGLYLLREIQGGSGYLSMNPKQQHIGLGSAESVDLQITWPSGEVEEIQGLQADQSHTIEQIKGS